MISVPPLQTRCPKCLDWVEIPVIADPTLDGTTLHITLTPDMTRPLSGLPLPSNSPAEIETTWRELVAERNALKAERATLKAELASAWKALRSYDYDGTVFGWLDHQIDAQLSALTAERDALKAEIGAAGAVVDWPQPWEAAPDGYEADSLESLAKSLAFVAEDESEIQRADPPQPYIDRALAWLASIEDELDTMDNMQLWGRFFGWLEAQR